jgi:hypothetical protein
MKVSFPPPFMKISFLDMMENYAHLWVRSNNNNAISHLTALPRLKKLSVDK